MFYFFCNYEEQHNIFIQVEIETNFAAVLLTSNPIELQLYLSSTLDKIEKTEKNE